MTGTDRRGFLRALALRAVDGAASLAATAASGVAAEGVATPATGAVPEVGVTSAAAASRRPAARRPERCPDEARVHELAGAEGLRLPAGRIDALIRRSVRLTEVPGGWTAPDGSAVADGAGGGPAAPSAWLMVPGGIADSGRLAPGAEIVLRVDRSASALAGTVLAGRALAEASASGGVPDADGRGQSGGFTITITGTPVPERTVGGSHRVDVRLDTDAHGGIRHPSSSRPATSPTAAAGRPLWLDAQLQLPRVWSDAVQALALDERDTAAYVRLRDRLAAEQGLEVDQGAHSGLALHRLLGHPDDTSGTMPGECAALTGVGSGTAPATASDPTGWNLLAQLSLGPASRLFVWSAGDPLSPADPARLVGLLR